MDKKISIIMLIYNTDKVLLDKSIGSLLNQTYKNLEIILLDDCSTKQETIDTLRYYESKFSNIKIVRHEANHGMLRGRVTGFKNCTGDYIAYLDSDDTASIDYYRTMLKTAEDSDADIVVSTFNIENEKGDLTYHTRCHFRNKIYNLQDGDIFREYMHQQGKNYAWSLVWNKLYRRDLVARAIDDIEAFSMTHNGLNMTEDVAFTCSMFIQAHHMVSCQGEGVNYYKHSNASTNVVDNVDKYLRSTNDIAHVFGFMESMLNKYGKMDDYHQDFFLWKSHYVYIHSLFKPSSITKEDAIQRLSDLYNVRDCPIYPPEIEDYYYIDSSTITSDERYKDEIISKIISDKTKVVSFDIFDTLIMREVFEPKDIFGYLDIEFNKINKKSYVAFNRIRIEAEENVRKIVDREEITFDEIYEYIENNYPISHTMCEKMKAKELELELKYIVVRKFGRKLYDIARLNGKRVVLTSDMYLSEEYVRRLINKCGYTDDVKIYLSSSINKTKNVGSLYKHVLQEEGIKPSEMVHLGDNYHSDYKVPNKIGINAYYIINTKDKFYGTINQSLFEKNTQYINTYDIQEKLLIKSMFGLVNNRLFDNPFCGFDNNTMVNGQPGTLGYFVVGMELVALMHWIERKVKDSDKIHFVARDGYLPMLAYQKLRKYNPNLPQDNYFYISRKALMLLDVKSQEDLASLDIKINVANLSIKKIAESFNQEFIHQDILLEKVKKQGVSYEEKFKNREEFYSAIQLFTSDVVDYKKHNQYCGKIVDNFKKDITPNNKFFDIGYSGRAESIISDILGYPIDSLYIHTNGDTADIRSKIGGFNVDCFLQYTPRVRGHIREHIFMKNAPSLIRYELENDNIKYVFEEYKTLSQAETITNIIQENALDYVRDFYRYYYEYMDWLSFPEQYVAFPYERYINAPVPKDKYIFSCVVFEDDMLAGQDKNLMDVWDVMPLSNEVAHIPGLNAGISIANKLNRLLPVGSVRRKVAKKMYKALKKVYRFFRPIKK